MFVCFCVKLSCNFHVIFTELLLCTLHVTSMYFSCNFKGRTQNYDPRCRVFFMSFWNGFPCSIEASSSIRGNANSRINFLPTMQFCRLLPTRPDTYFADSHHQRSVILPTFFADCRIKFCRPFPDFSRPLPTFADLLPTLRSILPTFCRPIFLFMM